MRAQIQVAIFSFLMSLPHIAQAGPDQPWNDRDGGGGAGLWVGAIFLFIVIGLLKAFPRQVSVFLAAVLVAWLASLLVGDAAALLIAVVFLVWLLRGTSEPSK